MIPFAHVHAQCQRVHKHTNWAIQNCSRPLPICPPGHPTPSQRAHIPVARRLLGQPSHRAGSCGGAGHHYCWSAPWAVEPRLALRCIGGAHAPRGAAIARWCSAGRGSAGCSAGEAWGGAVVASGAQRGCSRACRAKCPRGALLARGVADSASGPAVGACGAGRGVEGRKGAVGTCGAHHGRQRASGRGGGVGRGRASGRGGGAGHKHPVQIKPQCHAPSSPTRRSKSKVAGISARHSPPKLSPSPSRPARDAVPLDAAAAASDD